MNKARNLLLSGSILFMLSIHIVVGMQLFAQDVNKMYVVGFAQDTMANDWRIAQVRELEREFQKYPWIKFFYTDAKGETARQIKDIEDMINLNVDVLITSPRDSALMTPVIAKAANISMDFLVKKKNSSCCEKNLFFDNGLPA